MDDLSKLASTLTSVAMADGYQCDIDRSVVKFVIASGGQELGLTKPLRDLIDATDETALAQSLIAETKEHFDMLAKATDPVALASRNKDLEAQVAALLAEKQQNESRDAAE